MKTRNLDRCKEFRRKFDQAHRVRLLLDGPPPEVHVPNIIPPITDSLGKNWHQPAGLDAAMDDTHVLLTAAQVAGLAEYSTTVPTGVYPGKAWKAIDLSGTVLLRWFGIVAGNPNVCSRNQREVIQIP